MPGHSAQTQLSLDDWVARGWNYLRSTDEVIKAVGKTPELLGYAHHLMRAFVALKINGVLCVDGKPLVYLRDVTGPLAPADARALHTQFWNHGLAPVLVIRAEDAVYVFSGQSLPQRDPEQFDAFAEHTALVKKLEPFTSVLQLEKLFHEISTGYFFRHRPDLFDAENAVDDYLLGNLSEVSKRLTSGTDGLDDSTANALIGRLIFLCYLVDREVIFLTDYAREIGSGKTKVKDILGSDDPGLAFERLYKLFARLKGTFNGSMFDQNLAKECRAIRKGAKRHRATLVTFLEGGVVKTGQGALGFWPYKFSIIPVETISAIYEDFLSKEDAEGKRKDGAYYTPRHLAETVVDMALEGDVPWTDKHYLDAACGSGIFLVTIFNRLATHWLFAHPTATYEKRADELTRILTTQLCGVDKNPTACRLACFSLYLAFLDHFDPRDLRTFKKTLGRKVLPRLFWPKKESRCRGYSPVIIEANFLETDRVQSDFDFVIGNPPWAGRGAGQWALDFMRESPTRLQAAGRVSFVLPAKVLLNKTDAFQAEWFAQVTVERIVNLSDFRFILFEHAKCPCVLIRFTPGEPPANHTIAYDLPKVSGSDPRAGVFTIYPNERRRVRQSDVLVAARAKKCAEFWKLPLWATPRDRRLLALLDGFPKLESLADNPRKKTHKLLFKGDGIQPEGGDPNPKWWEADRLFLDANSPIIAGIVLPRDCVPVAQCENIGKTVHRQRVKELFTPPLLVASRGFGKVAFCDFPVLFQHALRSISPVSEVPAERERLKPLIAFLMLFLRSTLARYYLFHTSANWATERDQINLFELLRVPFPLPGDPTLPKNAQQIVEQTAETLFALQARTQRELEKLHRKRLKQGWRLDSEDWTEKLSRFTKQRLQRVEAMQAESEKAFYRYFDLSEEEITLVKDALNVAEQSSTPQNRDRILRGELPSLREPDPRELVRYAKTLANTLNGWASASRRVEARVAVPAKVDKTGVLLLTLSEKRNPIPPRIVPLDEKLDGLLRRIQQAAEVEAGRLVYARRVLFFEGTDIHLLKPAAYGQWTRSAALNDADEIFARVVEPERREAERKET